MPEQPVRAGTRVRLVQTVLEPKDRAPNLPPDTAELPYLLRVTGELLEDSRVGAPARVRTAIGRQLEGTLEVVEPADTHTFGRPARALLAVSAAIRTLKDELR